MKGQTQNPPIKTGHMTLAERAREVKARCPIEDVAAQYREVRPSGAARFVCRCLCGRNTDRRPSFTLYKRDNGFHCFACGAHGSVIDLVMLAEGCDFRTALLRLEGNAGPTVRCRLEPVSERKRESSCLTPTDQSILNLAAAWYHTQLLNSPKTLRYVVAERGLTRETISKLKIGYSNGRMLIRHIHAQGLLVLRLLTLGLVTARYTELLTSRVIFPAMQSGNVVYMIGRVVSNTTKRVKYLGLPDGLVHKQPMVVGTPRLGVIWVEGPFDVAALVQWGLAADYRIVGLLGTAHASMHRILAECPPESPHYLALDQDDAGERAAQAMFTELTPQRAERVSWAGAKDCGELLTLGECGQVRFLHALAAASEAISTQGGGEPN
jgi:DNA primase